MNSFLRSKSKRSDEKKKKPKKGREPQPSTREALDKMRDTEEMLMKKQEYTEMKIARELENARKYAKTNKTMALQALKRKKRLEANLRTIDGSLTTLEQQRMLLEEAHTNMTVLNTMTEAAGALKTAQQGYDVDKVSKAIKISIEIILKILILGCRHDG